MIFHLKEYSIITHNDKLDNVWRVWSFPGRRLTRISGQRVNQMEAYLFNSHVE